MNMQFDQEFALARDIPHRMQSLSLAALAWRYRNEWDAPKAIEIYFDGRLAIDGSSNIFINPAVELGLIHARALLEFLGLAVQAGGLVPRVQPRKQRQEDDFGIEQFRTSAGAALRPIAPEWVRSVGLANAFLAVFNLANKGCAHITSGLSQAITAADVALACEAIPRIVVDAVYVPLGRPAPNYLPDVRVREGVALGGHE